MSLFRVRLVFHSEWNVNQKFPKQSKQDVTGPPLQMRTLKGFAFIQSPQTHLSLV